MKSNLEKVSNLERKLKIEVPAAIVGASFNRVFQGIQKQANIKGFRPGKAPLATIKNMYSDRVQQDVAQDIIQKAYIEALREHKIEPINYPDFEFDVPEEGKDFAFSATIEVRPEITLKKYEGLDVEKEKFSFDEKKVEQVLNNIRASRAALVDVLEDRPAQNGDTAVIDFEGFVDGKPVDGGKGENHNLELGTNQFIEGFEAGVVGMKVGQEKSLLLKFPDPYHSAELAGKPVDFKVKLNLLKKKDLPELNDELIKSLGGNDTLESLTKTIREDLEGSEKKQIEADFKNNILKVLVKNNPVDVPPSLLKEQKQALVDDMKNKMSQQGMNETQFAEYESKWSSDFEGTAREMIQAGFLIDAIAKKHELSWNDEDLENKFKEYAQQT
jgi:trigger factor